MNIFMWESNFSEYVSASRERLAGPDAPPVLQFSNIIGHYHRPCPRRSGSAHAHVCVYVPPCTHGEIRAPDHPVAVSLAGLTAAGRGWQRQHAAISRLTLNEALTRGPLSALCITAAGQIHRHIPRWRWPPDEMM